MMAKRKLHPFNVVKSVDIINFNFFDLTTLNIVNGLSNVENVFVKPINVATI